MKITASLLVLLLFCKTSFAYHLKGGYIQYQYLGVGSAANTSDYQVTVYLFVSCTTTGPTAQVILGVFNASTNATVLTKTILNTAENTVTKTTYNACLSDPPSICYMIYTYVTTIELANSSDGYVLAVQDALRISGIVNISSAINNGITVPASIPGTINGVDYHKNSSPTFIFDDTAVICYSAPFTYKFTATDPDGDSLSYAFGNGLNVTNASQNTSGQTPAGPPYPSLTYVSGFSGSIPLGNAVSINSATGIISGTAPATTGPYIVAVYVSEWRNGVKINTTKKEMQINVANCSLAGAQLNAVYLNCGNFTFTFSNESTASNITSYLWNFGVSNSTADTSTSAQPTYTYADTGTYVLKLRVSNSGGCSDSSTASVKVYPGFIPAFTDTGSCYQSPIIFNDASYAKYGSINGWLWNFGDPNSAADTSSSQNTSWLYSQAGLFTVTLAVTSTEGCSGTASKTITVNDKPTVYIPFTDTLICSNDTLPLIVQSTGSTFTWAPAYNISDTSIGNPKVYPTDTTTYTVIVQQNGCVDTASITVNVLQFITVSLTPDTAICKTDSISLNPVSYALSYLWTESDSPTSLSSATVKYPKAAPSSTTTYYVRANLGHCQDSAAIIVYVSPYPSATVSNDTSICYGKAVRLSAVTSAAEYTWSPANTLYQANTLTPLAGPGTTTAYILTVKDTAYCPKSVSDTIIVAVIQPIQLTATSDTTVVINQPLQLTATASDNTVTYVWSPSEFLNNTGIYDPVATITSTTIDSITYYVVATTPQGCSAIDSVTVKIYKTGPEIFVPTAFTPNGDGKNDIIRPILAGISKLDFFKIYNRWGQLLFETSTAGTGWNGTINGQEQPSGTYVFMVQAKDYLGAVIFKKGTIVLIR